jgi:hypothetical protein
VEPLAARHRRLRVELGLEDVTALEECLLPRCSLWLGVHAGFVEIVERHARPRRAERVAVEVEAVHAPVVRLIGKRFRRRRRVAEPEDVRLIVRRLPLLGPLRRDVLRRLRLDDRVASSLGRLRLRRLGR